MRTPCCQSFLAFILKFLNFLQTFIGLSIILYSVYMLNQWTNHSLPPVPPPSSAPSPDYSRTLLPNLPAIGVSGFNDGLGLGLRLGSVALPAPWFIYAFMGVGIVVCCIACIGYIAAEAINGCCLCFYTLLAAVLILLEAGLVAFITLDRHWEKDLPFDPTGELDSVRAFIEDNIDICMWVGILVLIIQALSVLTAMVLRAMVSAAHRADHDIEGDYDVLRGRTWEPLLNPQLNHASGSIKGDGKGGGHSDIWSSRMREKYGLKSGDRHNLPNQSTSISIKSNQ